MDLVGSWKDMDGFSLIWVDLVAFSWI